MISRNDARKLGEEFQRSTTLAEFYRRGTDLGLISPVKKELYQKDEPEIRESLNRLGYAVSKDGTYIHKYFPIFPNHYFDRCNERAVPDRVYLPEWLREREVDE